MLFFGIDFASILYRFFMHFSMPGTTFYIIKQIVSCIFAFSKNHETSMILASILASFWMALGILFASFSVPIFASIFRLPFFRTFGSLLGDLGRLFRFLVENDSKRGIKSWWRGSPFWRPFRDPRFFIDFGRIWDGFLMNFGWILHRFCMICWWNLDRF